MLGVDRDDKGNGILNRRFGESSFKKSKVNVNRKLNKSPSAGILQMKDMIPLEIEVEPLRGSVIN